MAQSSLGLVVASRLYVDSLLFARAGIYKCPIFLLFSAIVTYKAIHHRLLWMILAPLIVNNGGDQRFYGARRWAVFR
jgi:hypothetical protein